MNRMQVILLLNAIATVGFGIASYLSFASGNSSQGYCFAVLALSQLVLVFVNLAKQAKDKKK